MSTAKEIRGRIASVKNIKKITHAMEMIAASKLRAARNRMDNSKPYHHLIREVIGHVANAHPEYKHPYLIQRPVKRVGLIVISTDRGFCGSLNTNLFKRVLKHMQDFQNQEIPVDLALVGSRSERFFTRVTANIISYAHHLGDKPKLADLIGTVKVMLDAYDDGKIDRIDIAYNEFANTITQKPIVEQLLPAVPDPDVGINKHWDYIYEPDAKELLTHLLTRYTESQVYQAVVENIACGHAATMVAMKSATDNAGEMIDDLQLEYNKARQAAITKELAEIVSGADAIE